MPSAFRTGWSMEDKMHVTDWAEIHRSKNSQQNPPQQSQKQKVLLFDIEGTITSIDFVKKTLFSYFVENVEEFLKKNWTDEVVQANVKDLKSLTSSEITNGDSDVRVIPTGDEQETVLESLLHNIYHWVKLDKKLGPLKSLQGLVWKDAYHSGKITGHLYDDVVPFFEKARTDGFTICIYSSGSVAAQKLLFTFSKFGDLTPIMGGYFDTTTGLKGEAESYRKIAKSLQVAPANVRFFTDIEKEAVAARDAGMAAVLLERPGNAQLSSHAKSLFTILQDFTTNFEDIVNKN